MNTSKKLEQNVCKDSQFQVTDLKSVLLDRQSGSSKVTNENTTKFWFESGEMTSESRANLDLSLSGTNGINGGVSLFNIDPSSIDRGSPSKQILKVITIVFQGKTYEQTNEKRKVKRPKRIRPWFYQSAGNYYFEIKYGTKSLEVEKKKPAIAAGSKENLLAVIDAITDAAKEGFLDNELKKVRGPIKTKATSKAQTK